VNATRRCLALAAAVVLAPISALRAAEVDFGRDVRPVISDNCVHCHGPDDKRRKAGLRLDTRDGLFEPGADGTPAVIPGKSADSPLFQRISTTDEDDLMPPPKTGHRLTPAQVATIKAWIDGGAPWRGHWAFLRPARPPLPEVSALPGSAGNPGNPIDRFVAARLAEAGLALAAEADRSTLLRRVTLDLTGLPPTLAEIDQFKRDRSPRAYEKAVDRLLASPRYGERMVQEWLEAARYADTNGFQNDGERAMWPWRDWAVRALNANMPFDRFTIEQLAGDLLPNPTEDQLIATGFNRNHPLNGEGGAIAEESRVGYVMDRTETTMTVWLGLTATCSRCHDHKYDPLRQREYYQFFAFFNRVPETGGVDQRNDTASPVYEFASQERLAARDAQKKVHDRAKAAVAKLDDALSKGLQAWEASVDPTTLPEKVRGALAVPVATRSADERTLLRAHYLDTSPRRRELQKIESDERKVLDRLNKDIVVTMVMKDAAEPRDTFMLTRGEYDKPGEKVAADVPAFLPPLPPQADGARPDRLALARWLVSPENPLTARVTVNRAWQTFFGTGIVKTSEDFGTQGEPPSHPELLDWLATELVRTGWDMKALHRLIVTSATYRQRADVTTALLEKDPENRLLGRGPRFRLSSHALRDQALALAGLLVEQRGGPPVRPYQPDGVWEDFSYGKIKYKRDAGPSLYRRSLYTFWRRSVAPTSLFDVPGRQVCNVRASRTNSPLHALATMNDPAFVEAARVWAEKLLARRALSHDQRIGLAFRMATARAPSAEERAILRRALDGYLARFEREPSAAQQLITVGEREPDRRAPPVLLAAYTGLASLILNLDETLTKE
jgi:hypothetical protein